MDNEAVATFAPQLYIKNGTTDISFYLKAFDAVELRRRMNDDGSLHVAELSIGGAMFHLHEETAKAGTFAPTKHNGTTTLIGLFVANVDDTVKRAIAAGAIEISAPKDYEYGYRQAEIKDPFGHYWLIEMRIG